MGGTSAGEGFLKPGLEEPATEATAPPQEAAVPPQEAAAPPQEAAAPPKPAEPDEGFTESNSEAGGSFGLLQIFRFHSLPALCKPAKALHRWIGLCSRDEISCS